MNQLTDTDRMKKKNLIGRQVSRLRYQRGWTQDMLADKLQLTGWMISRSGVSKIEGGSMYVPDFRLFYFAHLFKVEFTTLFPKVNLQSPIHEALLRFVHMERRIPRSEVTAPDEEF
ncbi:MAG: helix-turn-helix domain-containing protein [Verrucomicrobiales bacterium]|nr:helix-turn-helix domain-containing protein [Verrucomicrobiales bacterium]